MAASYDEGKISLIAAEVAEAIEQASLGRVPWTLPAEIFSAAFPGGFAALVNQDFVHDVVNFIEWVNMDDPTITSYVDHFAYINPWAEYWTRMPSGSVFVAEKHRPARTFADTEYYNDWLLPQGDVLGGVGLKVDASPTDVVFFPMHYPSYYAETYDEPAAEVSRRLVAPIQRAIDLSRDLRMEGEGLVSRAAVTDRAWPALVVDASMTLCEANSEAETLLIQGDMVSCRNGRIRFKDPALTKRISSTVSALAASAASASPSFSWGDYRNPLVFSFSRLPQAGSLPRLIAGRRQILIIIKRLASPPSLPDLAALAQIYGLTGAELRLCTSLYAGRTLQEAAVELGISYEAVRTRTKTIFAKTGTRGQSGLCALLARYSG
jgi:DNA-binding CsgD family transcriptional regulator